ncbi:permease [Vibrio caribbeanicus ATCC BAA-2122]|uniref:Permease n=1 Tax=Vibrio caribbeanicus ATCC BAA-2122 TaxID=796620 RepID=E3BEU5_9VIBR|nr:MFS transporter [Vibrio caribbeanicus]EFP98462.1 permease [Vibrio caribbeanicus ATCC BAA-2122]
MNINKNLKTPFAFLVAVSIVVPIAFSSWMSLLNNFVIEKASFTGADIGLLQSVREIPGFLAFTAVFILIFIKEQRFILISLLALTGGTAITGFFPSLTGLLFTTLLMSTGFHYFETLKQSLALQWLPKKETPELLGKLISVGAFASILTYGALWFCLEVLELEYKWIYLCFGGFGFVLVLWITYCFPTFESKVQQNTKLVLRKRYWLYYALTFMSGARRQIFVVFAGFLMVEKFGYSAAEITLLFMINYAFNLFFAGRIGRLIGKIGERNALIFEYTGLFFVFLGYAFVDTPEWAAALYVIDHLFFALALALKTYLQKIADSADMASTAGVSFTINHIAAVVIPVCFGFLWLSSPAIVFYAGAGMSIISLLLSCNIPRIPCEGNEVWLLKWS